MLNCESINTLGPRGRYGDEFQEMLDFFKEYGYYANADTSIGKELIAKPLSFADWVRAGNIDQMIFSIFDFKATI